jgi:hypothetical protein
MIDKLQQEVEDRVAKIRPDFKTILSLYLSRFPTDKAKSLKYSVKFLEFPQVLMKECQYWGSIEIPKPSLDKMEEIHERIRRDRNEIVIQLKYEEMREQRTKLLSDCDHMFLTDYKFEDQRNKQLYIEYRKYLRDLPSRYTKHTILNFEVPNFEEWKKQKGY